MVLIKIYDFIRNSINVSTTLFWNFVFLHIYHKYHFKEKFGIIGFGILLSLFAILLDEIYIYIVNTYGYDPADYHKSIKSQLIGI